MSFGACRVPTQLHANGCIFNAPLPFLTNTHKESQLHVLVHANDESVACGERFLSVWKERWNQSRPKEFVNMDTLGFEPRAFRMRSGCDTTTPCARGGMDQEHITSHNGASVLNPNWTLTQGYCIRLKKKCKHPATGN